MESKLCNLVEFKFLRNSYPCNENVLCYFGTTTNPGTSTHVPQVGDWVGIFKVGWKNLNEYKVRKFVSVESIETSRRSQTEYTHVVFEQMHLPKELEGHHQFVYVAKCEVVRGVSRPFEFEIETRNMKQELKEIRREMWNNVEERGIWGKLVEQEKRELVEREMCERKREREICEQREMCEREREMCEREREMCERKREREMCERERERSRERRERERRECSRERELREQRERSREREIRQRERELREREQRECSREERECSKERKQRERELRELCERERQNCLRHEINNNNTKVMESLEGDLLEKLCQVKLGGEETIVNRLLQKYLNCVRSKKDEDFSKRFEELFCENNKLSLSLRSRISEVAELKKECEELKIINCELVNKISKCEKKVEHLECELERGRETIRRQCEEREMLPESKCYLEKVVNDLDETKIMLKEENERLREELRRLSVLCQTESGLKSKWLKIDEINKRLGEKCINEIEKSTLIEMKGLKKLVEELRCENEQLKSRIRFDCETRKPEITVQYPVTSKTTIIKEKSSTHVPKVNSQPEYLSLIETRPICQEYPSISVSTSIPEISSKTSVCVSGKVSGPITEQTVRGSLNGLCLGKVERSIEEQVRTRSIAEHLRHELERLNGKLSDIREVKEQLTNDKCVEVVLGKEGKLPCWVIPSPSVSSLEEVQKQIQRQQQKQFLKHYEEQTKQQLKEQLTSVKEQLSAICPVCGIAVSKDLNQTEFELHVNSHFTD